jgi:adenylate cyclase
MGQGYGLFRPLHALREHALIAGGCLALLAGVASLAPLTLAWEEGVDLYWLFRARGERPAPNNVVLVPIDGRAARSLFLPASPNDFERCRDVRLDGPLPNYTNPAPPEVLARWPRCLHARALDALAAAQPEMVVMDISFRPRSDPSGAYAEQDRALAAAIRNAGKVVLARKIRSTPTAGDRAQPVAAEIEAAATAVAPFLVLGHRLERADKFCTFMETGGWYGPCLPAVAHQLASQDVYPHLREILERAAPKDVDLIRASADVPPADSYMPAPLGLIRHLSMSVSERLHALIAARNLAGNDSSPKRLSSLADVYLGPGIRYFNFYGPPGKSFLTLRYETLVAAQESSRPAAGSLRGKIVFIGFAELHDPEQIEHFHTPFTTSESIKLSGVELAATAYANLQDSSTIMPAAPWLRALITVCIVSLCTLFCVVFRPGHAWVPCLGLVGAYAFGALLVFDGHAVWLPLTIPGGSAVLAFLAVGVVPRYLENVRERDRFYEFMSALLPRRVVERIVSENRKLTDLLVGLQESVYGTCVFTDAKGFSALCERCSPEEVARIMDGYFNTLFRVVQKVGGEPSDTAGDAMLAMWTGADPSVRMKACVASLRLAAAAEEFNRTHPEAALSTRIGVSYGEMSRGMRGSPFHVEYRYMGNVPATANRLQDLNKRLITRVLVSEDVIDALEHGFLARYVGHLRLKGKTVSTQVYELIAEFRTRATSEQLELCKAFAQALYDYQEGREHVARERFEALQRKYPGDGPTAFYALHCAQGKYYGEEPIPVD